MEIYIFREINRKNLELAIENGFELCYSSLDKVKIARYNATDNERVKERIVISDALTRAVLSKKTGILPHKLSFSYGSHGKPLLDNADIFFNVSHSGNNYAVCTDTDECGIDIEIHKNVTLKSAKRFCRENELDFIEQSKDKQLAYLYIWTRKEAYLKSMGIGISTLLTAVDTLNDTGLCTSVSCDYTVSTYGKQLSERRKLYEINPKKGGRL